MFLHVRNGRFNFISCPMDRFSHFLWGGCSLQLNGTVPFQVNQSFVHPHKEIEDRLLLREHTIQAGF